MGLRWQRRLAWLAVVLLGVGPVAAAGSLAWYVRSGRLRTRIEGRLSQALGGAVQVKGLQVTGWGRYGVARLTLTGSDPSRVPILSAQGGALETGPRLRLRFARATVNLGEQAALAEWRRLLRRVPPGPPVEVSADAVRLEGLPEQASRAVVTCRGNLTLTRERRRAFLHGFLPPGPSGGTAERVSLLVEDTLGGFRLSLAPRPLLLGADRLARLVGWPQGLLPEDLKGEVVLRSDARGAGARAGARLRARGTLPLDRLAQRFGFSGCTGAVALGIDLERKAAEGPGAYRGTVEVTLADGPAQVEALALETFGYVLLGRLSEEAVEEDTWTVEALAFTLRFEGPRLLIEPASTEGPLLSARSRRGSTLRLDRGASTTVEALLQRARLALAP